MKSRYQSDNQHIPLPIEETKHLLTNYCFTCDLLVKAHPNNDSLKDMVEHLCWGDLEISKFFIEEIVESLKVKRTTVHEINNHFKIFSGILLLKDEMQE